MMATFHINGRMVRVIQRDDVKDAEVSIVNSSGETTVELGTLPYYSFCGIVGQSKITEVFCNRDWFDKVIEKLRISYVMVMTDEHFDDLMKRSANPCGEVTLSDSEQCVANQP